MRYIEYERVVTWRWCWHVVSKLRKLLFVPADPAAIDKIDLLTRTNWTVSASVFSSVFDVHPKGYSPMSMQPHSMTRSLTNEKILIAGPNALLNGAVAAAAQVSGCRLVRVIQGRSDLARMLDDWQPTLVVLDLELAATNQFEIVRFLREQHPGIYIVVMAFEHDDPQLLVDAFIVGINGVASKDHGIESLLKVLEVVCSGKNAVPRDLNHMMISNLRESGILKRNGARLTIRQQEVLRLVKEGLTDRDISRRLNISPTTVRTHLAAIFEKTATENRTSAARWASRVWDDEAAS